MNNLSFSANSVARVEQIQRNKSVMAPKISVSVSHKNSGSTAHKKFVFSLIFFFFNLRADFAEKMGQLIVYGSRVTQRCRCLPVKNWDYLDSDQYHPSCLFS